MTEQLYTNTGHQIRPSANADHELMLVTLRENGQEYNLVSTRSEFFGQGKDLPPGTLHISESISSAPDLYRFQRGAQTVNARFVSASKPETCTDALASFLRGDWNNAFSGQWQNAVERTSPNAKAILSQLLQPVLDACHGENRWDNPITAVHWSKAHPGFIKNLDTIFSQLNLIQVKRHRKSVTQGYAAVMCCGKELVRYGDDQWLQLKDGKISNGICEKEGKLYGQIIGGYGSATPDESFRRAALVQFTDSIAKILIPERSLSKKIEQAQTQNRSASSFAQKQDPTQAR